MMIDDWTNIRAAHEIKRLRRATFWVLLLDAVVLILLVGLIWLTCTHFLDTSLSEGVAKLADAVRGGK